MENMENQEQEQKTEKSDERKAKTPMEHWLKRQLPHHSLAHILEALRQIEAGVPVPYLAFYCSDSIGGLKSKDLYHLIDLKSEWEEIARRQTHMLQEIQSQGKLTDELKQQIERSADLDRLEDLYAPFKLKKQTLGVQAREAGLGVLAEYVWKRAHGEECEEIPGATLEEKATPFAKPESKYTDAATVLKGVTDLLVERIAESFELRSLVRSTVFRRGKIRSAKGSKAKQNSKYSKYFDYQEPVGALKKASSSYRYLTMRKGWMEDELVLSFERPDEGILLEKFEEYACPQKDSIGAEILIQAARLALKGNVYTVMENETHRHLKEEAEKHVIEVLAENLRKKLLRPGMGRKAVMGIDPGTAQHPCSLALLDQNGKLLLNLTFRMEEVTDTAKQEFLQSLENLKIEAIAIAHAARSKEVREGFKKILEEAGKVMPIITIHEHSANIYASSPIAKEEFPQLDVNARRAVFVARYLQDPLSLVMRIDPKYLSLGEFQHDVNQGKLRHALGFTIESSINFVGVNPNYAPLHVLHKVSGVNSELAQAIVRQRENTPFQSREDLKSVPGMESAFDHCAGFLRLDGTNALDRMFIHPKQYAQIEKSLAEKGLSLPLSAEQVDSLDLSWAASTERKNIAYELSHPGEDPRGEFQIFEYDSGIKSLEDLKKDTAYPGVITNVTSFGVFVDIGIEQDGLVHISELSEVLAKNPFDMIFPGDAVTVWVSDVNLEKKQISLTMRMGKVRNEKRPRAGAKDRRRKPLNASNVSTEGAVQTQGEQPSHEGQQRQGRRPRFRGNNAEGAPEQKGFRKKDDRKPREEKKRKPTRDPKTGAIVNLSDGDDGRKHGMRLATRAKPHTFNPFANLADLLKDKQNKNQG